MASAAEDFDFECTFKEQIGEGNFGIVKFVFINLEKLMEFLKNFKVYKAYLIKRGITLAVKETRGNFPLGPIKDDFKPLNEEVNILKKIDHKNIVRYKLNFNFVFKYI